MTELFAEEYPHLDLAALPDPARHVSRAWKKNDVRRRLRRLRERATAEFVYHRSPVTDPSALEEFFRLHDVRWKVKEAAGGTRPAGLFATEAGRRFLRVAAQNMDAAGWLRLSFVDVAGQPAVGRFGIEFDGCYYGLKSAFDPELAPYGPGHLVVGFLLEEAVARGLRRFDFMRGAGGHKRAWAGSTTQVGYHVLHRTGWPGDAQLAYAWTALRWRNRHRFAR
ncbi:MAG: GNAT family N-acetyltransferase [Egibacteraceae bacterium]